MLNNRIVIPSVVLLFMLLVTARLATARTEVASDPSNGPAAVMGNQQQSATENKVPMPSYRPPLDECFDVSLREAASCRKASQVLAPSYRSPLDECFDVPLREAVRCRNASQSLSP